MVIDAGFPLELLAFFVRWPKGDQGGCFMGYLLKTDVSIPAA